MDGYVKLIHEQKPYLVGPDKLSDPWTVLFRTYTHLDICIERLTSVPEAGIRVTDMSFGIANVFCKFMCP